MAVDDRDGPAGDGRRGDSEQGGNDQIIVAGGPPLSGLGHEFGPTPDAGGRGRALVVEDHVDMVGMCRRILTDDGYHVVTATSAEEALALADDLGDLQLLVTDLDLPGMDGLRLAAAMAGRFPGLGMLLMSGHDLSVVLPRLGFIVDEPRAEYSTDTVAEGGPTDVAFLAKPFTPDQLLAAATGMLAEASSGGGRQASVKIGGTHLFTPVATATDSGPDGGDHHVPGAAATDRGEMLAWFKITPATAPGGQAARSIALTGVGGSHGGLGRAALAGVDVLVVEDDASVRELCRQTLADDGHEVATASSAEEVLELADDLDGLRLLVTDIVMPGMDGAELSRALTDRYPHLAVVLMSGHVDGMDSETEAIEFLAKPFTPGQLTTSAAAALARTDPARGGRTSDKTLHEWFKRSAGGGSGSEEARSGAAEETDTKRGALVGFGSFSSARRLTVVGAAAGVLLLTAGVVLALGGGSDGEPPLDTARPDGVASELDGGGDAGGAHAAVQTSGEDDTGPDQGNLAHGVAATDRPGDPASEPVVGPASEPGADSSTQPEPEPDPTREPAPTPDRDPPPGSATDPEPTVVAYAPPSMGAPALVSCTATSDADGTTEYAVTFTVVAAGGTYDVLAGEPFVHGDKRIEVRGGELTWTVELVHRRDKGDTGDQFHVDAPSPFGWTDPGGDTRRYAHDPPPLAVRYDACG